MARYTIKPYGYKVIKIRADHFDFKRNPQGDVFALGFTLFPEGTSCREEARMKYDRKGIDSDTLERLKTHAVTFYYGPFATVWKGNKLIFNYEEWNISPDNKDFNDFHEATLKSRPEMVLYHDPYKDE